MKELVKVAQDISHTVIWVAVILGCLNIVAAFVLGMLLWSDLP